MKSKLLFYILILYLIKNVLSNVGYNFTKYTTYKTFNGYAVFDSSVFNIGDIMYFKITAEFNDKNLYYIYLDSLENLESILSNKDNFFESESYFDVGSSDEDDKTEIRYYKITKSKVDLNNLSGKYLILLIFADGRVEIENTEKDEGKASQIYTIIFSIIGVLAVGGIIFFCFCRDKLKCKKKDENTQPNNNPIVNNQPETGFQFGNGIYSQIQSNYQLNQNNYQLNQYYN